MSSSSASGQLYQAEMITTATTVRTVGKKLLLKTCRNCVTSVIERCSRLMTVPVSWESK